MSKLHYEFYEQGQNGPGYVAGDYVRKIIGSGTIDISSSMSPPIEVPEVPHGSAATAVLMLKVLGPDAVYVQFAKRDQGTPSGTGAHAAADTAPRVLIDEADGRMTVVPPPRGRFAAVAAASIA